MVKTRNGLGGSDDGDWGILSEVGKENERLVDEILKLIKKKINNGKRSLDIDAGNLSTGYKPDNGEEKTKELTQVAAQTLIYLSQSKDGNSVPKPQTRAATEESMRIAAQTLILKTALETIILA